ncbi:unnamed protein product [Nippostrongylus brasiliensis]|uniref:DUF7596 domain-containing protein n=1 Tax=Nippostrongylus brasiliensis TaxID=27835 RepID=A0A3P7C8D4_NIPBR|nr:unnamed protein product [Nippostrongylus brasiliensis]
MPFQTERENRRLLPLYVQFHTVAEARPAEAHLIDRLAENALGRFNLELKKNVTHDSFVECDSWRDEAGFIVTDRNRFAYVTFDATALLSSLTPSTDAKIVKYTAADLEALRDFDHTVCGFSRDEAVEVWYFMLQQFMLTVSFFTREDVWECKPISSRQAHRRHTRAVPSNIKWNKVYALNMGFHIV